MDRNDNNFDDMNEKYYQEFQEYKNYREQSRKQRAYPSYVLVGLASAVVGGIIVATVFGSGGKLNPINSQPQNKVTINAKDNYSIAEGVAEKTMSTVVGITTKQIRENNSLLFGPSEQLVQGVGSGVILSSDGYILTNSHVVADGNAQDIRVLFIDSVEREASVIWNDVSLDLAVIKVEAENLQAAELGDSDKVKIGEPAVAIGNPLGLEFERTVTSGIISGTNRSIAISENQNMEGLIQTDASINSGNSGGPLLNKEGKVVGINSLKIQAVEGMGFAQPINMAKPIIEQIINTGHFEEAYMGVYGEDAMRYQKATGRDFGADYGAIIIKTEKGSPAESAGLEPGDVIVSINGDKVDTFQSLRKILYRFKPGESVSLGIIRDKESKDIVVELGAINEKQVQDK